MKTEWMSLLIAAAIACMCVPAARAQYDASGSTMTAQRIQDLKALAQLQNRAQDFSPLNSFFDRSRASGGVTLTNPSVVVAGQRINGRSSFNPFQPFPNNNPYSPYTPNPYNPSPYNPNPYGPSPYYPGSPYSPYVPSPYTPFPVQTGPTLGQRISNFFDNIGAGVNNFRDSLANTIAPNYPYVTKYLDTTTPYGYSRTPILRYRPPSIDYPGYPMPGNGGYPGYPGYPGGGGYPGYPGYPGYGPFYPGMSGGNIRLGPGLNYGYRDFSGGAVPPIGALYPSPLTPSTNANAMVVQTALALQNINLNNEGAINAVRWGPYADPNAGYEVQALQNAKAHAADGLNLGWAALGYQQYSYPPAVK